MASVGMMLCRSTVKIRKQELKAAGNGINVTRLGK